MRPGMQDSASPRTLNLSQVVASVFHFRIVNTLPASISIHFLKFSVRQLSEIRIVKRVYFTFSFVSALCYKDQIIYSSNALPGLENKFYINL